MGHTCPQSHCIQRKEGPNGSVPPIPSSCSWRATGVGAAGVPGLEAELDWALAAFLACP